MVARSPSELGSTSNTLHSGAGARNPASALLLYQPSSNFMPSTRQSARFRPGFLLVLERCSRLMRYAVRAVILIALSPGCITAQTLGAYYSHVIFDNSLTAGEYFYSRAQASNGSSIVTGTRGRLPVETKIFLSPPNALRLAWRSEPSGGWSAAIKVPEIRNLPPHFSGDMLSFWYYSE